MMFKHTRTRSALLSFAYYSAHHTAGREKREKRNKTHIDRIGLQQHKFCYSFPKKLNLSYYIILILFYYSLPFLNSLTPFSYTYIYAGSPKKS